MGLMFEEEGLLESFRSLDGRKAPGVDGIRKEDYERELTTHIPRLSREVRRLGYRPKPSRRVYIPKANGGTRPLGIPCTEDKIVQDRMARVLGAIWEPQFCDSSYGYRPGRSAHDALKRLDDIIFFEKTQYVVEADIKSFFTSVSHEHLRKFLGHRINDPIFMRIVDRFLKAGVMEDGAFVASEQGTPQGGLVSPILSNIYLHYTLDLWFERRFARQCRGKAFLVRYCDDFTACFEYQEDADTFLVALEDRLKQFNLEVEPTKTRKIAFGSRQLGNKRAETFTFLGFTHYVDKTRKGGFKVGRKTAAKRIPIKLKEVKKRLKALRTSGGAAMVQYMRQHLRGSYQYYGISGNMRAIKTYYQQCSGLLFKWLNRRSQRRSLDWDEFSKLLREGLLPLPRVVRSFYS